MNAGDLFTFKDSYTYNDDSYAYIECTLLKDIGPLKAGSLVPEALINVKTSKIKLNVDDVLYIIPFGFTWTEERISTKHTDVEDSDFDGTDDDDDDEDADGETDTSDEDNTDTDTSEGA